jgi:hypothetical protein
MHRFKARRRRAILVAVPLALVTALVGVLAAVAALTNPGTFESGDGNLDPNNAIPALAHDWNNPVESIDCGEAEDIPFAGTNCGTDLKKNTSDNAFGQGAKEDIPNPTVVSGSIPPNKSDLTRFYVNHEKDGTDDLLYLAWERSNVLGSANMDFEFNQSDTGSGNGVTMLRTEGDMLITFDLTNGGSVPKLGLRRWLTAGGPDGDVATTGDNWSKSDCFSANALPCWGDGFDDLGAAGIAEGKINTTSVTDENGPDAPFQLPTGTFGEAGINLTDAGVFEVGDDAECTSFGSAMLKSRSSASFADPQGDHQLQGDQDHQGGRQRGRRPARRCCVRTPAR